MKGIVCMDIVKAAFSVDMLEDIIEKSELPNSGAYTAVSTYNH